MTFSEVPVPLVASGFAEVAPAPANASASRPLSAGEGALSTGEVLSSGSESWEPLSRGMASSNDEALHELGPGIAK